MAAQRPDWPACALAPTSPDRWASSNRTRLPALGAFATPPGPSQRWAYSGEGSWGVRTRQAPEHLAADPSPMQIGEFW
jgi:hypothetical protein